MNYCVWLRSKLLIGNSAFPVSIFCETSAKISHIILIWLHIFSKYGALSSWTKLELPCLVEDNMESYDLVHYLVQRSITSISTLHQVSITSLQHVSLGVSVHPLHHCKHIYLYASAFHTLNYLVVQLKPSPSNLQERLEGQVAGETKAAQEVQTRVAVYQPRNEMSTIGKEPNSVWFF